MMLLVVDNKRGKKNLPLRIERKDCLFVWSVELSNLLSPHKGHFSVRQKSKIIALNIT